MSIQYNTTQDDAAQLLAAETEADVTAALTEFPFETAVWKPLGGIENNYGIVENQQADPMAAMTELVVNSIDAILLKNYHERVGDEYTGDEFGTLEAAADALVDPNEEEIRLAADGAGDESVSLTLSDTGCGQPPERFEETFLGFLQPGKIKQEYEFLQGKYGMGSSGVLPFCGTQGYKLVLSAGVERPEEWSWTLIRKNKAKDRYEYLTLGGDVPTFSGTVDGRSAGTVIKLFDYNAEAGSRFTTTFRYRLERYLLDSPVPLTFEDDRGESPDAATTRGLFSTLDAYEELIAADQTIAYDFEDPTLGTRDVRIVLFEDDDALDDLGSADEFEHERGYDPVTAKNRHFVGGEKHREQAVFFAINGQTHGDQGRTFIRNRCSLPHVAGDVLVFVDFSDLDDSSVVDLFPASRDRLRNSSVGRTLKRELESLVASNDILVDEEQRRRQRLPGDDSDELVEDVLMTILERNPALQRYFATGDRIEPPRVRDAAVGDEPDHRYPETLDLIETYHGPNDYEVWDPDSSGDAEFVKEVPVDGRARQRLVLDAPNDFLIRDDPGSVAVSPSDVVKSTRLLNGVLTLTLKPGEDATPGERTSVRVEARPAGTDGEETLERRFAVEYVEANDDRGRTRAAANAHGAAPEDMILPNTHPIHEEDWDSYDRAFDEDTVVQVMDYDDELDLHINMDAAPLRQFFTAHTLTDAGKEYVKRVYKTGITLYAVAQYMELHEEFDEDDVDVSEIVSAAMRGTGQILLDQAISDDRLEELTV
ncbi:ATP-binding protein [Haladaptatus salinisoli]|uniref:ATP-binding protein n=1 Tax=Haladaptatus salinisoli TaxID=2884876 RepID=UPI001D0A7370|nr:ATP-binding protein [Haladaptatus salinisoli]